MRAAVTGAFTVPNGAGMVTRMTRNDLVKLFTACGWHMAETVNYDTDVLYALDPNGNTTKLRAAREIGVPVHDHNQLYADMMGVLQARNQGMSITPAHALQRIDRYGINNWRTYDQNGQLVANLPSGRIMPGGEVVRPRSEFQVRMINASRESAPPPPPAKVEARVGQLVLKRNVKI